MITYVDTDQYGTYAVTILTPRGELMYATDGLPTVSAALSHSRGVVAEFNISPRWAEQAAHFAKYGW